MIPLAIAYTAIAVIFMLTRDTKLDGTKVTPLILRPFTKENRK